MIRIFTCGHCSRIHLEIGNTQIHFNSRKHLQKYLDNLELINAAHYAAINQAKGMEKVIILSLDHSGAVHLGFSLQEFESFKADLRRYLSEEKKPEDPSTFCNILLNIREVTPVKREDILICMN
jgi:hypothetical protein